MDDDKGTVNDVKDVWAVSGRDVKFHDGVAGSGGSGGVDGCGGSSDFAIVVAVLCIAAVELDFSEVIGSSCWVEFLLWILKVKLVVGCVVRLVWWCSNEGEFFVTF